MILNFVSVWMPDIEPDQSKCIFLISRELWHDVKDDPAHKYYHIYQECVNGFEAWKKQNCAKEKKRKGETTESPVRMTRHRSDPQLNSSLTTRLLKS